MNMITSKNAILTKPLKRGIKTITGKIISVGIGKITLAVNEKGSTSIKSYNLDDYTINYY